MAKFTLDIVDDYPYIVYGINSTTSDYRLCWNINKELGLSLKRIDALSVYTKENEPVLHNHFAHVQEEENEAIHLIENKRGNSLFLPDVPQADYLFIIEGTEYEEDANVLRILKGIRPVLMAFSVDLESLKRKQNLLYIG